MARHRCLAAFALVAVWWCCCCGFGPVLGSMEAWGDSQPNLGEAVEGSSIISLVPSALQSQLKLAEIEEAVGAAVSTLGSSSLSVKVLRNVGMVLVQGVPTGDVTSVSSIVSAIGEDNVADVSPDGKVYAMQATPQCPQQSPTWGIDRIDQTPTQLDNSYQTPGCNMGQGVVVYVLDTGIRVTHNEFSNNGPNRTIAGYSAFQDTSYDSHGHGTHCAGTVGGLTYGVAKQVKLVAVKVLGDNGSGSYAGIIAGINWVISDVQSGGQRGIMSLSLGGGFSSALNSAIATAVDTHNIPVIVAAGNSNANACNYSPASEPRAYTVGSTTSQDARSSFSNIGTCVDIFAPGSSITSAGVASDASVVTMSGTSMATPHVAGAAALILSANSSRTVDEVYDALTQAALSVSLPDAAGAPQLLLNLQALPIQGCDAPVDCVVSNWGEWSRECPGVSGLCGTQTRTRQRSITTSPTCGGSQCPNMTETQNCEDVLNVEYPPCPDPFILDALTISESFSSLSNKELVFEYSTLTSYSLCIQPSVALLEHTDGKVELGSPGDDGSVLAFSDVSFLWYGENVTSDLYFGSNGYITLDHPDFKFSSAEIKGGVGDNDADTEGGLGSFFTHKRISPFMTDLAPNKGGRMIYERMSEPDRLVFTYSNIPYFVAENSANTFQVVIYTESGGISFKFGQIASKAGTAMVGLNKLASTPTSINLTDLLDSNACPTAPSPPPLPPPSPPADPDTIEYEYVRVDMTGDPGLAFAGLQLYSHNGSAIALRVSSSSTPYATGKYWSAEASIDRDAATCFSAASESSGSAAEGQLQTGFILYQMATPSRVGAIRIANNGPCGPSPNAFNGSLQNVSVSVSVDGQTFVEALPSTTIARGASAALGLFRSDDDIDLRYRPPFYGLPLYTLIIGGNKGQNGRTLGYEFTALTNFKIVGMGVGVQSKRFVDRSSLPMPLKISLWEMSSEQLLKMVEIPEGAPLINQEQVEGFIPPAEEIQIESGKKYIIEIEDMETSNRAKRFLYGRIRKNKYGGNDYNTGLIKIGRGRIGDTPGSYPTKVQKKDLYGVPYFLYDVGSLSSAEFARLSESPQVSTTTLVIEDETEEAEADIETSLSTEEDFSCSDECACDCLEIYDDEDDDGDDDYSVVE